MIKVAYNACFGGFSLSEKAIEMLNDRGYEINPKFGFLPSTIQRHNKDLIEIIELLGDEANGHFAKIQIEELPDDCKMYRIEDYDGLEDVITINSNEWIKI